MIDGSLLRPVPDLDFVFPSCDRAEMTDDGYDPEATKRVLGDMQLRKRPDVHEVPDLAEMSDCNLCRYLITWRFLAFSLEAAADAGTTVEAAKAALREVQDEGMTRLHAAHAELERGPEAYDPERFTGPPGKSLDEAWRSANDESGRKMWMPGDPPLKRRVVGTVTEVDCTVFAPHVDVVPGRMSGGPCFRGTRVDLDTLFANWEDMTVDEFCRAFVTVDKADVEAVLRIVRGEL